MNHFFETSREEAAALAKEAGFPAFRTRQLYEWVYEKNITSLDQMTNLGQQYKEYLERTYRFRTIRVRKVLTDSKGETIKFLLTLDDGNTLEMVIMRYLNRDASKERNTLCLSSQVGCPVGCPFCATGKEGLVRNLRSGEILEQVSIANEYLKEFGARIGNVVFMGMGEPLLNREQVFAAAAVIHDDFGISSRRITISTSGHVEGIRAMADQELKYVLAVSLHAARNELRDELVPLNRKYPLEKLMEACRYYRQKTGKRITFEYIMLRGVNDSLEDALALEKLTRGIPRKFNLIPFNPFPGSPLLPSSPEKVDLFAERLRKSGFVVTVRESRGQDVQASCGNLFALAEETTTLEEERPKEG